MKTYNFKTLLLALLSACSIASCSLEEAPEDRLSKDKVFETAEGLELYSISFYNILPDAGAVHRSDASINDLGAVANFNGFLRAGEYTAETAGGWSWSELRSINYFLENNTNPEIDEHVRQHYNGMARFVRAYFYFQKVVRFGDVPWIDKVLSVTDEEQLMAPRDSRTVVMDNILKDLDFAIAHLSDKKSDSSTITKWVALAFKSRVCLFEGTFRKYHTELGLQQTAQSWLQESVKASEELMKHSGYKIYTGKGANASYRALFISDAPITDEIILANVSDQSLGVLHDANWFWTSGTYGTRFSFISQFVNTFLMLDGSRYTDKAGYEDDSFLEETQGRDARLAQIIRTPGYKRDGQASAPNFNGYTFTGYQPIKFVLDPSAYDDGALNTNALPIFRYAEVLLNYAEAKAELGTLTNQDWANTIGELRKRAGITGGLSAKPTQADPYLQKEFYPNISDPSLLEIRRERAIELVLEGQRFEDLLRWKCGELLTKEWVGIYVPSINTPMDLDQDGTPDVIFYQGDKPKDTGGATPINVNPGKKQQLTNGTSGRLTWAANEIRTWYPDGRQYYYPIPQTAINKNPNLKQNPGW